MGIIWSLLAVTAATSLLFFALVGLFTFFHLLRPQRSPADTSNRINAFRLWWFALTRQELFVDVFPWLKRDELDNVSSHSKDT